MNLPINISALIHGLTVLCASTSFASAAPCPADTATAASENS
ncbi:MAG: hypothetical protein WAU91_05180 [Desulfatitalea sp.]